jgi:hypothetical protein
MPPVSVERKRPAGRNAALLAVFVALAAMPAAAQRGRGSGAGITSVNNLQFGQLIAGIAEPVAPTDLLQRGHFVIEGERRLDLQLILPASLQSATGAPIPVVFRSTDGILALENRPSVVFNPNTTIRVEFRMNRDMAQVYLGGVASPAADQAAGTYSATVTILLIDPQT